MELSKAKIREIIAKRVAKELKDGDVVNLGIGLPTEVVNYIPNSIFVTIQSENGLIGMGETPSIENIDPKISNAGGEPVSILPGGCFWQFYIIWYHTRWTRWFNSLGSFTSWWRGKFS